uniref:Uncharacterized protein n=1 Tax=Rhipicephalus microplus TaxID=6941 RepID=A0A6G5AEW6_RHIMP
MISTRSMIPSMLLPNGSPTGRWQSIRKTSASMTITRKGSLQFCCTIYGTALTRVHKQKYVFLTLPSVSGGRADYFDHFHSKTKLCFLRRKHEGKGSVLNKAFSLQNIRQTLPRIRM